MKVKKITPFQSWYKWFAWRPVKANGYWVWLEYVGRYKDYFYNKYRAIKNDKTQII